MCLQPDAQKQLLVPASPLFITTVQRSIWARDRKRQVLGGIEGHAHLVKRDAVMLGDQPIVSGDWRAVCPTVASTQHIASALVGEIQPPQVLCTNTDGARFRRDPSRYRVSLGDASMCNMTHRYQRAYPEAGLSGRAFFFWAGARSISAMSSASCAVRSVAPCAT